MHAARLCSRRLNGRVFRCDPSRRLRLSPSRLVGIWYRWKKEPSKALVLGYGPSRNGLKASAELVRLFVAACLKPGAFSFVHVYGSLPALHVASYRALVRAIPDGEREKLKRVFRLRCELHNAVRSVGVHASSSEAQNG